MGRLPAAKAIDSLFDRRPQAKSFGMVYRAREERGEVRQETVFYIRNHPPKVKAISRHLWNHRAIEDCQHWVVDVTLAEDASRIRKESGPAIAGVFWRMALNILLQNNSLAEYIRGKRLLAVRYECVLNGIYADPEAV